MAIALRGARDFLTRLPSIIGGTTSINGTPVPLSAGQYVIPVARSTAQSDGDVVHEVQYGQSLWSIAITYGTTIDQILKLNNLGDSTIVYEQQQLLVQKGATQPAVILTQTATDSPSGFWPATPSPTITQTGTVTEMAAPSTGKAGSIVVILIIGISILIAGVGATLRVKPAP